jgi:hypothetical protein
MLWYNNPEGIGAVHRSRVEEKVTVVTERHRRNGRSE